MSIATEATEEVHHLLMQHCVVRHACFEIFELRRGGQLTVKQQIAHFQIVGFCSELINWIPAVQQLALAAINECDGRIG